MKMIAIIEVPDDMYDDYPDWYITSWFDDLEIRYEEDGSYMNFKTLGDEIKLKPLPPKISQYWFRQEMIADGLQNNDGSVAVFSKDYEEGWNNCLEEIKSGGEE